MRHQSNQHQPHRHVRSRRHPCRRSHPKLQRSPADSSAARAAIRRQGARLAKGTAARKLGASIDILAPGKRGCPYHLHHAQEEMFIILEGNGTLRVAAKCFRCGRATSSFITGTRVSHQIINTSAAPLKYLSISTMRHPRSASTRLGQVPCGRQPRQGDPVRRDWSSWTKPRLLGGRALKRGP